MHPGDGVRAIPADYVQGTHGSHMTCAGCGEDVHYGPAVAAIRDPADLALDDDALASFACYHTSSQPDWPSSSFAANFVRGIDNHDLLLPARGDYIAHHTTKALHVGTYEAAIERGCSRF